MSDLIEGAYYIIDKSKCDELDLRSIAHKYSKPSKATADGTIFNTIVVWNSLNGETYFSSDRILKRVSVENKIGGKLI